MLKWHVVAPPHIIAVLNHMVDHIDGFMLSDAKKMTQWKHYLNIAVIFAQQKLSKYYSEVTPTTCLLRISAHIIHLFRKMPLFGN